MQFQRIPKVVFQTSLTRQPQYVVEMIKKHLGMDWEYRHFTNKEIIHFFATNPHPEFPRLVERFYSFKNGAHRADLFRYYYLFMYGGVFLDSDAMIEINIEDITQHYQFFSVDSWYNPYSIFQGFIGAVPRNPIIYEALKHAYTVNPDELEKDYWCFCKELYKIVKGKQWNFPCKLYNEGYYTIDIVKVHDALLPDSMIALHHCRTKRIPQDDEDIVDSYLNCVVRKAITHQSL